MWRKGKIAEFMRYCFVGGIAAAIHYAVYYILQFYMNVNLAYTIGYAVSLTVNFFLTSYVTFRAAPSLKRAFGFGGSHLLNYLNHIWLFNLFFISGLIEGHCSHSGARCCGSCQFCVPALGV